MKNLTVFGVITCNIKGGLLGIGRKKAYYYRKYLNMRQISTHNALRKMSTLLVASAFALTASAQSYYVQSTCDYAPMATTGTFLCLGDDVVSSAIPLGFTFNFYGTNFTDAYVSSNGFLSFTAGMGSGCCTGQILPSATFPNTIFLGQEDWDPNSCIDGDITYYTTGAPGSQIFVLSYTDVPHYPGPEGVFPITVQCQLYEATGEIRIVTTQLNSDGGLHTMGLNHNGTEADIVPGRNSQNFSAFDECISFTVYIASDYDAGVVDVTSPISDVTMGVESVTVSIKNYGLNEISGFPVSYTVDGGAPVTETFTGTIPSLGTASYTFATTYDFTADGCYDINAYTSLADDGDATNDAYDETVCNLGPITGTGAIYVYSNTTGGEPWFTTSNTTAMTAIFGTEGVGWNRAFFETLDPVTTFSSDNCFIFLEGSDAHANELETFLTANMTLIENWVSSGGKLLLNAAPNEGDGMSFGFGGTSLVYAYYTNNATAADPAHPIFAGPLTPVGTDWTGSSFGHAIISGTGLTNVIVDLFNPSSVVLAEKSWGSGTVMFGGMTTNNFHTPLTEAANLRANILNYLSCTPLAVCEVPTGLFVDGITTDDAILHWDAMDGADQYRVTLQNTATGLIKTKGFATNMVDLTNKLNPLTTYAFRVKTVCYDDLGTISAPSAWYYFTTLGRIGEADAAVSMFPNPSNGAFTINVSGYNNNSFNMVVSNATGQTVYSKVINVNSDSYSENIDLSNAAAGMYQVSLMNETHQLTYPIVVIK